VQLHRFFVSPLKNRELGSKVADLKFSYIRLTIIVKLFRIRYVQVFDIVLGLLVLILPNNLNPHPASSGKNTFIIHSITTHRR